ncbi:MAG: response regulator [Desulfoferrobacter sp.]
MVGIFKKRLANKILITIIAAIILIMGTEIAVRIYFGTKDRIELINIAAWELAASTYAGMKHPMAVGDAKAIVQQMADIKETAKDVQVHICDFEQEIIYSTDEDKLRTKLASTINNPAAAQTLNEILETGISPNKLFEDKVSGERRILYFYPILNQPDCYHCHGSSRKVLGSMAISMSVERAYATVAAQRNRTVLLTIFGVSFVILMTYLTVNKFIRRPVQELAQKAKRLAEGDMSVKTEVKTEDEIGVLGSTFNYMVDCISSARRTLEEEVARKTDLLEERTRLITLLEKANRELRNLDQLKSTFLANMSHELRTPMNSIIGYTDLLIDGVDGPINEEQERSLHKIASNSRYLLQLINDILDISKIESGKTQLSPKELDIVWLIQSVTETIEPLLKQKQLNLRQDFDAKVSTVYGDEDAVRQILMNLLSNAVKFTEEGEISITVRPSERGIEPDQSPIFAEVCVEDTGIGIKEQDLGLIFDKFVQVDLTTVRHPEGTGLGLSIARALVALHKGMIWAKSDYGKGSRFCFTIPLSREILDGSREPIIEPRMAGALADYFGTPMGKFLMEPEYAGRKIRCWHYVRCGQPSCPAYGSEESRCWLILGTHCAGLKIASYPEKVDFCKGCELIESIMLKMNEPSVSAKDSEQIPEESPQKVVLAIDDNPDGIDIIRKYLGEEYTVIGLLSGEDAVEKAKALNPKAITLDILMPEMDGWQVLQNLKKTPETQEIPVIIVSILDDKRLGFSLGAAEYMVKPIKKNILLKQLRNLEAETPITRILVADNEVESVRRVGKILKDAKYEVLTSYNSEDAIRLIKDFRPQLVVLNLTMPQVSGLDVIEFLQTDQEAKELPLIILTSHDLTEPQMDALNGRIQAILNKGVLTEEDLVDSLKKAICRLKDGTEDQERSGG